MTISHLAFLGLDILIFLWAPKRCHCLQTAGSNLKRIPYPKTWVDGFGNLMDDRCLLSFKEVWLQVVSSLGQRGNKVEVRFEDFFFFPLSLFNFRGRGEKDKKKKGDKGVIKQ